MLKPVILLLLFTITVFGNPYQCAHFEGTTMINVFCSKAKCYNTLDFKGRPTIIIAWYCSNNWYDADSQCKRVGWTCEGHTLKCDDKRICNSQGECGRRECVDHVVISP